MIQTRLTPAREQQYRAELSRATPEALELAHMFQRLALSQSHPDRVPSDAPAPVYLSQAIAIVENSDLYHAFSHAVRQAIP